MFSWLRNLLGWTPRSKMSVRIIRDDRRCKDIECIPTKNSASGEMFYFNNSGYHDYGASCRFCSPSPCPCGGHVHHDQDADWGGFYPIQMCDTCGKSDEGEYLSGSDRFGATGRGECRFP